MIYLQNYYLPFSGWRMVGHDSSVTNQPCQAVGGYVICGDSAGGKVSLVVGGKTVLENFPVVGGNVVAVIFEEPVYAGSYDVTVVPDGSGKVRIGVLVLK